MQKGAKSRRETQELSDTCESCPGRRCRRWLTLVALRERQAWCNFTWNVLAGSAPSDFLESGSPLLEEEALQLGVREPEKEPEYFHPGPQRLTPGDGGEMEP